MPMRIFLSVLFFMLLCDARAQEKAMDVNQAEITVARLAPDNMTRSAREGKTEALKTPEDQGESEGDFKITSSIRKALVDDETLATNSKNVKIITINGIVTLRGSVESMTEKNKINAIAEHIKNVVRVDDYLEVKAK